MNSFTALFLALLALMLLAQLWLGQRHAHHVAAHRNRVPEPFRRRITLAAHRRAADYTVAHMRLGHAGHVAGALLLLGWTLGGGLETLERVWRPLGSDGLVTGTAFLLSALLIQGLLELPLDLYRTFVVESRFGFNRVTPGLYVADLLKKTALLVLLGAPLAAAVLWLLREAGALWWWYAWMLWTGFSLLLAWAYPTWIAPWFNRFRPLPRSPLRTRIQALLRRTGYASRGIYVIDSSRRTTHGNAYFAGLGRHKRVVFFDSLLDSLRGNELVAVLAHEIGHYKRGHVAKRLLLMNALSLAGFAALGWLIGAPWFYAGLGVPQPSPHAALMLFLLVGPVFTFFLSPLLAWASRRHEYEADRFAAEQTVARDLIRALTRLYRDNARTLTPDPLHSAFYDSHPPALARIAALARPG